MDRTLTNAPSPLQTKTNQYCQSLNPQPSTLNPKRGTRHACAVGNQRGRKVVRKACLCQIHISTRCFSTGKPRARKLEYDLSVGSICGIVRITQRISATSRKVKGPPRYRLGRGVARQLPTRSQTSPRLPCNSRQIRANRRLKELSVPPLKASV